LMYEVALESALNEVPYKRASIEPDMI
jgi:hypothetical protein